MKIYIIKFIIISLTYTNLDNTTFPQNIFTTYLYNQTYMNYEKTIIITWIIILLFNTNLDNMTPEPKEAWLMDPESTETYFGILKLAHLKFSYLVPIIFFISISGIVWILFCLCLYLGFWIQLVSRRNCRSPSWILKMVWIWIQKCYFSQ